MLAGEKFYSVWAGRKGSKFWPVWKNHCHNLPWLSSGPHKPHSHLSAKSLLKSDSNHVTTHPFRSQFNLDKVFIKRVLRILTLQSDELGQRWVRCQWQSPPGPLSPWTPPVWWFHVKSSQKSFPDLMFILLCRKYNKTHLAQHISGKARSGIETWKPNLKIWLILPFRVWTYFYRTQPAPRVPGADWMGWGGGALPLYIGYTWP